MATKFQLRLQEKQQINKVNKLVTAIKKVQGRLKTFKLWADVNFHSVFDKLTEEQKDEARRYMDSFKWNKWHELEERLVDRFTDANDKLHEIRFDLYGLNAY